jgi:hypothetical protein
MQRKIARLDSTSGCTDASGLWGRSSRYSFQAAAGRQVLALRAVEGETVDGSDAFLTVDVGR